MALVKKVYGVKTPISPRIFAVHGIRYAILKSRKPLAPNQNWAASALLS